MESCLSALRSVGSYTGCDRGHPHDPTSSHLDCSNGRRESAGFPPPQGCLSSFRDGSTLQRATCWKNFGVKWCIAVNKKAEFHLFGYNFSHTFAYINENISLITQFFWIRSSVFAADTSFCWVFVWWIILPGCLLLVWGYHLGTQFTK